MTGRILRLIFGVIVFLSSTPVGMAKETISAEVRADSFVSGKVGDSRKAVLSFTDVAALAGAEFSVDFESQTEVEKQSKRQKRTPGKHKFLSKCRIATGLSAEALSKGVAKRPGSQDARQQRTSAIRFLHLAALIDC